jgi:hypothetical protein
MEQNRKKNRRGCSGFHFFLEARMEKLRREGTPWSGTNAAADFSPEWEELPAAEREKYERRATEK